MILTVSNIYNEFIKRFLWAFAVVVAANIAIGYIIALATDKFGSVTEVMGLITSAPVLLYALITTAAFIICGNNWRAWLLSILLVLYANLQIGNTIAFYLFPNSIIPIMIVAFGFISVVYIVQHIYIKINNTSLDTPLSTTGWVICLTAISLSYALSSTKIFDVIYPIFLN